MAASVLRTEQLSPTFVRIVLGGGDLARFPGPAHTDAYVKVMFLHPDGDYARPIDPETIRASMPREYWPRLRTYTVRAWDADRQELTLDFVVHGDEVLFMGPGGAYSPDPAADWHLLVGDESALPAIAAAAECLPDDAIAHLFVEIDGPDDELPLKLPAGATLTWLHRGTDPVGERLVEAVTAFEFPVGDVHAFVHGEAGFIKRLRRWLLTDKAIPRERLSISGYWRVGVDDESWRAIKADFDR